MKWNYRKIIYWSIFATIPTLSLLSNYTGNVIQNQVLSAQTVTSTETKQLNRVGKFLLVYQPSANESSQILQQILQQSGIFENIVQGLNNSDLVMRVDIPVVFQDCGVMNAFYDPENHSITMCYELIFQVAEDFQKNHDFSTEDALVNAIYASVFVFHHELGHALIDVLDLPSVGKEEDAVDQFAVIILLNTSNSELAKKTILSAATWFSSAPKIPAWDEHAPNDVRFYNLICLVYGSDPDEYAFVLEVLPQERAAKCPSEYAKVSASWQQLLLPHFAEVNRPWGNRTTVNKPPSSQRNTPGRIW